MNVQKINGTIEVGCPDGYEVDMEKSKFGLETVIHFKPIETKKELPKTWEELKKIEGCFIDHSSSITQVSGSLCEEFNRNIFATEEQAKASIALAQLSQLREVYRQGWVPDWKHPHDIKYSITELDGEIYKSLIWRSAHFLSFQSEEIRDQFLKNFRNLIEEASPLLFG